MAGMQGYLDQNAAAAQTPRPPNPREVLLDEVRGIVTKDRNSAYGNPEDNFRNIANLWNAYLGGKSKGLISTHAGPYITPMDVAVMNVLIKVARLANNPGHRDSLVDIAGYAACGADIQESMKNQPSALKSYLVQAQNAAVPDAN